MVRCDLRDQPLTCHLFTHCKAGRDAPRIGSWPLRDVLSQQQQRQRVERLDCGQGRGSRQNGFQALRQLCGRLLSEGDHQKISGQECPTGEPVSDSVDERPCLAGTRRGLHQDRARRRADDGELFVGQADITMGR